jgi:hypothetical protein
MHFDGSGFFGPQALELKKLTHERGVTPPMVLIAKPLSVPTLQGGFKGKVEEITVCTGLKVNFTDYLALRATQVIL